MYFSRSYWRGYWHDTVVCLSVCLFVTLCNVEKIHLTAKASEKWIGSVPYGNMILQLSTPYTYHIPLNSPPPNLEILLIYHMITLRFCYCCNEHGLALLSSRWWLINASYAVRSAILGAAAALLVINCCSIYFVFVFGQRSIKTRPFIFWISTQITYVNVIDLNSLKGN